MAEEAAKMASLNDSDSSDDESWMNEGATFAVKTSARQITSEKKEKETVKETVRRILTLEEKAELVETNGTSFSCSCSNETNSP